MPWTCIALGSNLGNRLRNLQDASAHLKEIGHILKFSSVYWSAPYGNIKQNSFLNAAILFHTRLTPDDLMNELLNIENKMGRIREQKWGPRNIDLDIIFYEDKSVQNEKLHIPHPDFQNRNFVLLPLAELIPEFVPPGYDMTVNELADKFRKDLIDNKIRKYKRKWMT